MSSILVHPSSIRYSIASSTSITQEELKKPDHDIEKELVIVCGDRVYKSNNIVFWYNDIQNEEDE